LACVLSYSTKTADDPSRTGGTLMAEPSRIRFAQVLARLMDDRYKRNRAALARSAHVSPSALSQYARGRATPALAVLVDLAQALEVSLDYLVYGQDSSDGVEYATWAQHLEDMVRRMASEAASFRQLVDRVGIDLSSRMYDVVSEVVRQSGAKGGALTTAELAQLEVFSIRTRIATVDLDADVLLARETSPDEAAAPGPFAKVVAANIVMGRSYEYIIPDNAHYIRRARLIVQEIQKAIGTQLAPKLAGPSVSSQLRFFVSTEGLVPSYVIYTLDHQRMVKEKPLLYGLIEGFLGRQEGKESDPGSDLDGALGLIRPPNPGFDVYPLISRDSLPILFKSFYNLRNNSDRLSFPDQSNSNER